MRAHLKTVRETPFTSIMKPFLDMYKDNSNKTSRNKYSKYTLRLESDEPEIDFSYYVGFSQRNVQKALAGISDHHLMMANEYMRLSDLIERYYETNPNAEPITMHVTPEGIQFSGNTELLDDLCEKGWVE